MKTSVADSWGCSGDAGCNAHKRANHCFVLKLGNDVQFPWLELFTEASGITGSYSSARRFAAEYSNWHVSPTLILLSPLAIDTTIATPSHVNQFRNY